MLIFKYVICIFAGAMIRLFKVKEKQKELAENANGGVPIKKQTAGELRLHKDISELNLPKSCAISFPNGKDDLMNFEVSIRPDEGYYFGGTFLFSFQVSPIYPHEAPKVKCKTKVYHPNIDLEGNVCLNILREDWKPVLNINTIIYGLYHLFTEPNYEDPLNHDAAAVLRDNPKMFESNVRRAMAGGRQDTTCLSTQPGLLIEKQGLSSNNGCPPGVGKQCVSFDLVSCLQEIIAVNFA
ncbi:Ubiquitin-conjugating enzyme E2 - like 2 [Theobroma cacao]|nr:Ubiquitin-conjugating enzyme E2 - like 2 [Theobroma cacao]